MFVGLSARCLITDVAIRSTNLSYKCSMISPGNPVIFGSEQKVKVTSHKSIVGVGVCTLVSAGFL